jgi:hypothetical protein
VNIVAGKGRDAVALSDALGSDATPLALVIADPETHKEAR